MTIFVKYTFLFATGSIAGWLIELFYRHYFSNPKVNGKRKWINPGFLTGPYLPLYGFSSCVLYLLSELMYDKAIGGFALKTVLMLLIMSACVTAIEFIAGLIFIKGMKIKLWDYSGNRGNIAGIICPLYSFYWMLLGGIYYFVIYPYVMKSVEWLFDNIIFSYFVGMFLGVFLIDFARSTQLMIKIKQFAEDNGVVIIYEEFVNHISKRAGGRKNKIKSFFAKNNLHSVTGNLSKYLQDKVNILNIREKNKKDK